MLVECLVACVLLTAASLVSTSLAESAIDAAARVRYSAHAGALAQESVERTGSVVCTSGGSTQVVTRPALRASINDVAYARWHDVHVEIVLATSPWARRGGAFAMPVFTLRSAHPCP
jgi:hypothetical protein